jgi:hypothetical protein
MQDSDDVNEQFSFTIEFEAEDMDSHNNDTNACTKEIQPVN